MKKHKAAIIEELQICDQYVYRGQCLETGVVATGIAMVDNLSDIGDLSSDPTVRALQYLDESCNGIHEHI